MLAVRRQLGSTSGLLARRFLGNGRALFLGAQAIELGALRRVPLSLLSRGFLSAKLLELGALLLA